ncbi:regulatory protein NosR [Chelatococcus daeguensis]|uniref:NosR/NirI family protein n=1 Tax=Chelatococcus daeguensis TaxID=444444 RepID=UPI0007ABF3C8|nr:4Fe-4S binding protein [Chelatococcus daeguensis]MBM3083609.1 regulatory protein NosR [Chelatococcus daeguensis]
MMNRRTPFAFLAVPLLVAACLLLAAAGQPAAAGELDRYLGKVAPQDIFPQAERFGPPQGEPPIAPVMRGEERLGFVYLNSDFANAVGYSGKPIKMLVGIEASGVVRSIRLVDHKEPIVLIGIPEERIVAAVNSLIGKDMAAVAHGAERPPQVDIVSGATVTVLVMGDSVVRSAVSLMRSGRLGGGTDAAPVAAPVARAIDMSVSEIRSWEDLVGDGSVRRLNLSVGEVNEAFARAGQAEAAAKAEGENEDLFIDLYAAPVSVPTIGRSLLGDEGYERLTKRLAPGQHALLVAGEGAYSFKGSGYVRGGIFDRIELVQDGSTTRFRDRNHTRLGDLAADGAPDLPEIALFVVPEHFPFDPAREWDLQLLVQRPVGARDKAFLTYDLAYRLPERYLVAETPAAPTPAPALAEARPSASMDDVLAMPLWERIWRDNTVNISIAAVAIAVLTLIFFFQDWLVSRPRLFTWVRRGYLAFTLFWLGWWMNAQLSVVNVITFTNALITGFSWEYFLAAPLVFILWSSVAAALLFWGRGPFCGWLCPFGALQELTNNLARFLKVPQLTLPWGLHERLWPLKYIIFLVLFGLSLHSVGLAEQWAEVEPFKTAIILKFAREWPFVIYALTLLSIGLFIERFFCRYLCPLGAALAIPGRIRMFEWLKRWPECGSPCHRCAKECPVEAIHPEGHINVNECIYCMHCQELYHDDQRCPHMIQVRVKRERWLAQNAPRPAGEAPNKPIITRNGKAVADAARPAETAGAPS